MGAGPHALEAERQDASPYAGALRNRHGWGVLFIASPVRQGVSRRVAAPMPDASRERRPDRTARLRLPLTRVTAGGGVDTCSSSGQG